MKIKILPSKLKGEITPCSSKSICHRVLICGCFNNEVSAISNLNLCDDVLATIQCLRSLGANIELDGNTAFVSKGNFLKDVKEPLNCNESGSTLRMLIPFALLAKQDVVFIGSKKLLARPLDSYFNFFNRNNIKYELGEDFLKIYKCDEIRDWTIEGNISSQFITGLILACSYLNINETISIVGDIVSKPYVILTNKILNIFGKDVILNNNTIIIKNNKITNFVYTVEADESNAAALEAFNFLDNQVILRKTDSSLQGDSCYKNLFKNLNNEIDLKDNPDLAPILMAIGSITNGVNLINTARLKDKESDRGEVMKMELNKIHSLVEVKPNSIQVYPSKKQNNNFVNFDSHNDHRIVMAETLLGSKFGCYINNAECINKSFPEYFKILEPIGLKYLIEKE